MLFWIVNNFLSFIAKKFFIKKINGLENLPSKNYILVSNHQSNLDEFVGNVVVFFYDKKRFRFIAQTDKWHNFKGIFVKLLYLIENTITVDRKSKDSKKRAVEQAINTLKKGKEVLIMYPEGSRSLSEGKIQKGKWGVAKIFLKTGVPIVPMGIKGSFDAVVKMKKEIVANIGAPLYFQEEFREAQNLSEDSSEYKALLIKITDKVMEEIKRLYQEA